MSSLEEKDLAAVLEIMGLTDKFIVLHKNRTVSSSVWLI